VITSEIGACAFSLPYGSALSSVSL